MKRIVEEAEALVNKNNPPVYNPAPQLPLPNTKDVFIYCWRGGMRSAAIGWLLNLYGFRVTVLIGGYKTYRKQVLETFSHPFSLKIIGGYTGSGKTEILHALEKKVKKSLILKTWPRIKVQPLVI